jgi:hypothetical protein
MKIHYINTDLDLVASRDLTSLAAALKARDVFPLHVTYHEDGLWYAIFENEGTFEQYLQLDIPEKAIAAMLDAIESLDKKFLSIWSKCSLREFNIGYECGDEPWAFNNGLTNTTLVRMAKLGASLRVTIYPPNPTDVAEEESKRKKRKRSKKKTPR